MGNEGQPLLLVSQSVRGSSRAERPLLSRVVIPIEVAERYDHLPTSHIWWVEKTGRRFNLRAKLYVAEATVERELTSGLRRAIWHLDTTRSERITWADTRKQVNVTSSLTGVTFDALGRLALTPISADLNRRLEGCRISVLEQVLTFEDALRVLRRRFSKIKDTVFRGDNPPLPWNQALCCARAYFAREELVGMRGYDPYEIAAAILAGYTEMPRKVTTNFRDPGDLPTAEIVEFTELDEEHLGYVERKWGRHSEVIGNLDKLEIKTKKHQQILQLLARHIRAKGLRPTYNRHVDLRVGIKDSEVLFEVKTADALNFQEQVRRSVSQLLEYRYRYKTYCAGRQIILAAVIEAGASSEQYEFARGFLSELGIAMVLWRPDTVLFDGLADVLS